LLGVKTSVLRFWEKEFGESIKPLKVGPRKRLYRPHDLEIFQEIKRLLHEERYTIAGARQRLAVASGPAAQKSSGSAEAELTALKTVLAETKENLLALRKLLASAAGRGRSGQDES
jgi:DNA-binding transcriptional MerR regulator